MLQVLQHQKTGEIIVEELPIPQCFPGGILVEIKNSLISAGTEKTSVDNAKASLLERVKRQPDQVKLVMDFIKKEGVFSTLERVRTKLNSYKSLGYSASGIVLESDCPEFSPGDRVAVAGAGYAIHSEVCAIPKNLAVKLTENVDFESASYTTVAAIALQGVRRAEVQLGENIAVIGLGLIGQITVQLLKANGANVVGFDIDESTFDNAIKFGCKSVFPSSKEYAKEALQQTNTNGFDSVIITASTSSNQPLELAIDLLRKKGKVIIVGAVSMNIARGVFYQKELDLRIATSYGPGRYDTLYEELGMDYPIGYVRWTENRNMDAIIELLAKNQLNFSALTTHNFHVKEAKSAYELISGEKSEKYLGIVLNYPERENKLITHLDFRTSSVKTGKLGIGFIGAGTFAQNYLLPAIRSNDVNFVGISNSTALSTKNTADKFGFKSAYTSGIELANNTDIDLIFCASRHDSHAKYVTEALKNNKHIYVEKPLAVNQTELEEIQEAYNNSQGSLMVGFNRRFSDSFQEIRKFFSQRKMPLNMIYRVNAGQIPKNHWVHLPEQGGRIIGEVCHFVDTLTFLAGSLPVEVFAFSSSAANQEISNFDNVSINLKFADGSIGTIIYTSTGDSGLPKEYCEVYAEGKTAIMNNFSSVQLFRAGKEKVLKFDGEKGIKNEIAKTCEAAKNGKNMPISPEEIFTTTRATFLAIESLKKGEPYKV
ncbi:MAG: hypothetical protein A2X64_01270 [Ignavibacteria bacterium GWF2_33_9]|nr:MAG: hypothetical protein A2X64_01270 [Ignavibacteria bacterium GWF2_33_9]